jgi:hypothetical protein
MYIRLPAKAMEDNQNMFEALFEKATDYGKTTLQLTKLKTIDKTTDVVSTIIPHSIVLIIAIFCLASLNIGLSIYFGEMLGKIYYGFFLMAGFYALVGVIVHFLLHDRLKRVLKDYLLLLLMK